MMTRLVRPIFWNDPELAKLPHSVRLLLVGLWSLCDREGRLFDLPRTISAQLFAYEADQERNVRRWLDQLCPKFISRYALPDGRKVIQINDFKRWQKVHADERRSEIPPASSENAADKFESLKFESLKFETSGVRESGSSPDCRASLGPSFASPAADFGRCSDASPSVCAEKNQTRAPELILDSDDPRYDPEEDYRVYGSKAYQRVFEGKKPNTPLAGFSAEDAALLSAKLARKRRMQ